MPRGWGSYGMISFKVSGCRGSGRCVWLMLLEKMEGGGELFVELGVREWGVSCGGILYQPCVLAMAGMYKQVVYMGLNKGECVRMV